MFSYSGIQVRVLCPPYSTGVAAPSRRHGAPHRFQNAPRAAPREGAVQRVTLMFKLFGEMGVLDQVEFTTNALASHCVTATGARLLDKSETDWQRDLPEVDLLCSRQTLTLRAFCSYAQLVA